MSMKSLRKAVNRAKRDTFDNGTVVRWTASGRYDYAAIKTEVGWFTTARSINSYVPQVVEFDELLEILGRSETSNVLVASGWLSVGDEGPTDAVAEYDEETTLNVLAQRFYEASNISLPSMTDKPKVVRGLRAVFDELGISPRL